jgi:protocatechuate 3,4-dioxygenase beta subunit
MGFLPDGMWGRHTAGGFSDDGVFACATREPAWRPAVHGGTMTQHDFLSRRHLILTGACAGLLLPVHGAQAQMPRFPPQGTDLPLTPICRAGDLPTPPEIEGPYFKPRSPERSDLREPGIVGRPVDLSGLVLSPACRPVADALVELWHADSRGAYDNTGFRLRGHVFTDAQGRYAFRTIFPGPYPGRTRHYHIKVKARNSPMLTTQLYFPDDPQNRHDEFFHRELVMQIAAADDALHARFDVVLEV